VKTHYRNNSSIKSREVREATARGGRARGPDGDGIKAWCPVRPPENYRGACYIERSVPKVKLELRGRTTRWPTRW